MNSITITTTARRDEIAGQARLATIKVYNARKVLKREQEITRRGVFTLDNGRFMFVARKTDEVTIENLAFAESQLTAAHATLNALQAELAKLDVQDMLADFAKSVGA